MVPLFLFKVLIKDIVTGKVREVIFHTVADLPTKDCTATHENLKIGIYFADAECALLGVEIDELVIMNDGASEYMTAFIFPEIRKICDALGVDCFISNSWPGCGGGKIDGFGKEWKRTYLKDLVRFLGVFGRNVVHITNAFNALKNELTEKRKYSRAEHRYSNIFNSSKEIFFAKTFLSLELQS